MMMTEVRFVKDQHV